MTLHVNQRVMIIDGERASNKVYVISDISYDKADDGTPIEMYNLYDETTEEILEEPFYESELRLEVVMQDKIYTALDDIANYSDVKKLTDKELLVEVLDNISTTELLKLAETFNKKLRS